MAALAENPTKNVSRLAMETGFSRQTLYTWQKEGCPLDDGAEAVREWASRNHPKGDSNIKQQQEMARLRKWEADARAQELENMEVEGELISRSEVIAELAEILTSAKTLLESLVDELAKESPQELRVKVREISKHATDRFFRKLSHWRPGSDA